MKFIRVTFVVFFAAVSFTSVGAQIDYSGYDRILSANVSSAGEVDYAALIKNDKKDLGQFLEALANVDPGKLNRNQQLAFWINAYNAFTIQLIIDHWPVNSIKDISNGEPWDVKWIKLNGQTYSLNQIEHDIIRPDFNDPRIHFAVNCAARSCPPLLNEAYLAEKVDQQLDSQTKSFVNNLDYNNLSKTSIQISRIFDWYKQDFGNVIDFINNYAKITINPSADIRYTTYDWDLNN